MSKTKEDLLGCSGTNLLCEIADLSDEDIDDFFSPDSLDKLTEEETIQLFTNILDGFQQYQENKE